MILTLDISTTQTGWCWGDPSTERPAGWGSLKPKSTTHRPSRIAFMLQGMTPFLDSPDLKRVIAEDLSVGSKAGGKGNMKAITALAECRGVIQHQFWVKRGITVEYANLSTVKSACKPRGFKGLPTKADLRSLFSSMGMETKNEDESDAIAVWIATKGRKEPW